MSELDVIFLGGVVASFVAFAVVLFWASEFGTDHRR